MYRMKETPLIWLESLIKNKKVEDRESTSVGNNIKSTKTHLVKNIKDFLLGITNQIFRLNNKKTKNNSFQLWSILEEYKQHKNLHKNPDKLSSSFKIINKKAKSSE